MTETVGRSARAPAVPAPPSSPAAGRARPRHTRRPRRHRLRAVVRLYARLTWRTSAIIGVVMAGYVALEVASYRSAYPQGVSPLQFAIFEDNPAVRMMNGVPRALDTAGGFTVWDGGWMMQVIIAVWAILTTSRLLRGERRTSTAPTWSSPPRCGPPPPPRSSWRSLPRSRRWSVPPPP